MAKPRQATSQFAKAALKVVWSHPSTIVWPLLALGTILAVGVWGITEHVMEKTRVSKLWRSFLLAGLILLATANALLLFALLVSRRRHQELREALLPRRLLTGLLYEEGSLRRAHAGILQADTPADLLLSMMAELLEGRMPDVRDVVFIRTALMRNMDVYQPLNLKHHITGANLDADVAQSLMIQLGGIVSGGGSTAPSRYVRPSAKETRKGGVSVRYLQTSLSIGSSLCGTGTNSPSCNPSIRGSKGSSLQYHQQQQLAQQQQRQQQQQEQDCSTLANALALILTPQPLCWQDPSINSSSPDTDRDVLSLKPTGRDGKPVGQTGSANATGPTAPTVGAGPDPPSGLLEKAASLILHRDRDRTRRRPSVELRGITPGESLRASAEPLPRVLMPNLSGSGGGRLSTSMVPFNLGEPPQPLEVPEFRVTLRRSCDALPVDDAALVQEYGATGEVVDCDSGGVNGVGAAAGGVSGSMPHIDCPPPRRLSAVWGVFGRRGGTTGLISPRKRSLDGVPGSGAGSNAGHSSGHYAIVGTTPPRSFSGCRANSILQAQADTLQPPQSRLSLMTPPRAHSLRLSLVPSASAVVPVVDGDTLLPPQTARELQRSMPPPPAVIEETERLLAQSDGWQFNTWKLQDATQGHALSALGFYLIQRAGLISALRLKPITLARLLRQVEAGYNGNPYHSAIHAADVLQTLHVIMHATQLHVHYMDPLGLLAAYFAAIVHDYGHPGLTNDFLMATSDPLAVRYNDRSPLENHHCAASFELLQRPELNVLAHLPASDRSAFRKQVIEMVLATDMKQHFSILSHFNTVHRLSAYTQQQQQQQQQSQQQQQQQSSLAQTSPNKAPRSMLRRTESRSLSTITDNTVTPEVGFNAAFAPNWTEPAPRPLDDTERLLSLQVALKCADIGHLGEALEVHKRWLNNLEEEFFRQGDREKALGLPISPLFDRAKQGVSKSQVGFYDFVALPLVHALSTAFPGAQPLMRCFLTNYNHWRVVEGQSPVELPPSKMGRRSNSAQGTAGSNQHAVGLGSLLLSVPDALDLQDGDGV